MNHQIDLAAVVAPALDFDVFPFMNRLRQAASGKPPAAVLRRFHDALLRRFPDSPWATEYAGHHGRLTLHRADEVLPHVLHLAAEFGLTVLDKREAQVHRPPRYEVLIDGAMIKKGLCRSQAMKYTALLLARGRQASLQLEAGSIELPEPPRPAPPPPGWQPAFAFAPECDDGAPHHGTRHAVADVASESVTRPGPARLYYMASGLRMVCMALGLCLLLMIAGALLSPLGIIALVGLLGLYLVGSCRLAIGSLSVRVTPLALVVLPALVIVPVSYAFASSDFAYEFLIYVLPGLSVFLTLWLASAAMRHLKGAGLELGVLGASSSDIGALREAL
jgi:hypothetical protein